jgi:DNA-directed RNA polymerase specialized sigma24 family protein
MGEIGSEILTRLLDAHGAALVLYAQQWCDTPEDVTQEAFLALMHQPALPDNAVGWLYRVVRNGAINAVRAAERRTKRESAIARENEGWFQVSIADRLDAVEAARAKAIAPFIDANAFVVIRVDVTRVNVDALFEVARRLTVFDDEEAAKANQAMLRQCIDLFLKAGCKDLYVVLNHFNLETHQYVRRPPFARRS